MAKWLQRFRRQRSKPLPSEAKEDFRWRVGGRYELLEPLALVKQPDLSSKVRGRLLQYDTVLLLALKAVPSPTQDGEMLLAYLANTRQPSEWVHGWGHLEGDGVDTLQRQRLRGSWEAGGRYRVLGSPVLRRGIELESAEMYELQKEEEVLVLELGFVLRDGEPRLRAYVRTDAGELGWLTIELPGSSPLLEPVNLYSEEAVQGPFQLCRRPQPLVRRSCGHRVSLGGISEGADEAWEVEGKYRLLERATLCEAAALNSKVIGTLKAGTLVLIEELCHVSSPLESNSILRLRVSAEGPRSRGWISSTSSSGEAAIDVRDHLEYEKLLRSSLPETVREVAQPASSHPDGYEILVQLRRYDDTPLGLHVIHSDGKTLQIMAVVSEGLVGAWNSIHPDSEVQVGDRITTVNGSSGDAILLLEIMGSEAILDLTIRTSRPRAVEAGRGGAAAPGQTLYPGCTLPGHPRPEPLEGSSAKSPVTSKLQKLEPVLEASRVPSTASCSEECNVAINGEACFELSRGHSGTEESRTRSGTSDSWRGSILRPRSFSQEAPSSMAGESADTGFISPRGFPITLDHDLPWPGMSARDMDGARQQMGSMTAEAASASTSLPAVRRPTTAPAPSAPAAAVPGSVLRQEQGPIAAEVGACLAAGPGPVMLRMRDVPPQQTASALAARAVPRPGVRQVSTLQFSESEEGPDWRFVEVTGTAEQEETQSACPCKADWAWVLSDIGAIAGCGGRAGRMLGGVAKQPRL